MEPPASDPIPDCPTCRELFVRLHQSEARILELETKLRDLEDKLKPPPPKRPLDPQPPAPPKKPTGKKRGAQPGHKPHLKTWLPRERVKEFVLYIPDCCAKCDKALSPEAGPNDPEPTIFQVAELPKVLAEFTQHEGHSRTCSCGHVTHKAVPAEVRAHCLGPNLTATVGYLSGSHGMSKRGIEETMESLFGVPVALGTISNSEREVSEALAASYQEVRKHVAGAEVKYVDETGWKERGLKRWLWAAATASTTLFLIHPRRNLDALKLLLGKLAGVLVSDRWKVYDNWNCEARQLCWAHAKRNWDKQIERGGKAKALGERWQARQKSVFELWHRFRGGGCTRGELSDLMVPQIEALGNLLQEGMRSRDGVLARFCERLMDRYPLYWLFTAVEGVEPTNNHAERVQRRAVIWRKRSFGCQSSDGCRFVERILTAVQTLRLQGRNTLEFLGRTLAAHRAGSIKPKLCPTG